MHQWDSMEIMAKGRGTVPNSIRQLTKFKSKCSHCLYCVSVVFRAACENKFETGYVVTVML